MNNTRTTNRTIVSLLLRKYFKRKQPLLLAIVAFVVAGNVAESQSLTAEQTAAQRILANTGVTGGVISHIGCADGKLTAALRVNDRYLVHGLDVSERNVRKAREYVQSLGLYGPVSISLFDGTHLPYADNIVNLIVAEKPANVSKTEMLRVLTPRGTAYVKSGTGWTKIVKPWPDNIDEWTHYLHGSDGNAVARDSVVGPPRHMQWAAAPLWMRHHNTVPSTTGMVSARGRVYYVSDEAPPGLDADMPDNWFLVARDAFNGTLLWKKHIEKWGWNQWNTEWVGRFNEPPELPKRIVAAGDRLFATLNFNAPVSMLDGATGKVLRVFEGTDNTDEILYKDGTLILSLNEEARKPRRGDMKPVMKSVCAIDVESGKMLWKTGTYSGLHAKTDAAQPFGRLELLAGDDVVCLVDSDAIVCLDKETGKERWRVPRPAIEEKRIDAYWLRYTDQCVLVYNDGVLLFAQPDMTARTWHSFPGILYAYSIKDGSLLWQRKYGSWPHNWQSDVFVVDGLVWIHDYTPVNQPDWRTGHREDKEGIEYYLIALDLKNGSVKRRFSANETMYVDHHHRCYRAKATERFFLPSRRGVEFLDFETGDNSINHWTRGTCLLGIMPCNGLLYLPAHPCKCYVEAQLVGYNALASRASRAPTPTFEQMGRDRLDKGPAYGCDLTDETVPDNSSWPTFRHDSRRSGFSTSTVSDTLDISWRTNIGGRLTQPVVADGKVYTASIDQHRVVALSKKDGSLLWDYTADGRVDTPPTLYRGLVLFGDADGTVTCLTQSDGTLVWRFHAAPAERLVGAYDQLESAWPVHGSILIENGKAYVAAGRSSYLDDGFALYILDPATGKVLENRRDYSANPVTDEMYKPTYSRKIILGTLSDVLVSDGTSIFMRQEKVFGPEPKELKHLFSTAGLLDDSWFNRTYWAMGKTEESSQARLMVFDKSNVYAITETSKKKKSSAKPSADKYQMFADVFEPEPAVKISNEARKVFLKKNRPKRLWTVPVPLRITAMAVAGKTLVAAGTPSLVGQPDPLGARAGRRGGGLWLMSTDTGKKLAELDLDIAPVLDGLAVANGHVYMAATNGELVCFGSAK
ncbi:MAG: PQQ-binding-like beta-propeller repeat protein [Candidatus Hydrogenedentes bacterium]|nr:PQQ-binding-like beta-propeller repeat protein [Candidatus Hydrogenedentota bacterium]